MRQESND